MLGLDDFLGTWRVERTIEDRLGSPGRFEGLASIMPEGEGLCYHEEGTLVLGDGPAMAAHRDYLWRWAGEYIEVLFADGRTFHGFRPEGRAPGTDHPCGRDLYRVIYDFTAWPRWTAEWTVTGPTKDYRMVTAYAPAETLAPKRPLGQNVANKETRGNLHMAQAMMQTDWPVLAEIGSHGDGATRLARQAMFVALGIAALTLAAQIKLPLPPSPVPVNLGTLAVLSIGAAYGPRLGLVTILGYMILGALGADVFASSTAENNGLHYMMGATGGYLLGYVLSTVLLGALARRGWDRNVGLMALAMLLGNAVIYIPGVAWIHHVIAAGAFDPSKYATAWEQTMVWGLTPYLIGDAIKLALAALLFPTIWKLVGAARA